MKSRIFLPAILLAAATSAYAQPSGERDADPSDDQTEVDLGGPEAKQMLPVHLQNLIEAVVNLSPDLAKARADRTIARDTAEFERRNQQWVMSAQAGYAQNGIADHVQAPPYSVVEQDTINGTVGLGRNLPTGGSISFEGGIQHQHTEYNILDTLANMTSTSNATTGTGSGSGGMPTDEDAYSITSHLQVTYKQPLLRGLGNVAVANERKADLAATEATVKAQLAAEDTLKDVITQYWELAYSTYEVDIRLQALDLAHKQEIVTHDQMRAGTVPPSAINSVQYEIYSREEAVQKAQIDVESKSLELLRKSGLDLKRRDTVLHPAEPLEIGDDEFDIDEVLARARTANRKLATLKIERKSADVDVQVADDLTKPQVDLNISGGLIGIGDTAGDSLAGIGNRDGYQVQAGLSMSWEIGGAAKKGRDAAEAKRRRLDIDEADAARQIETQTVLAVKQVAAARKRVDMSKKAERVADENVRSEKAQFVAGRTTNFNVMQRQGELINARLAIGRAQADYHIAVAQLQYLSGVLLDQYGIDVKPHAHR
ncbi:MAG TPA: TolC family protein [Kofleriaceae bacterium]|nr:TolC family protein [Kofleriaceae bacterium]